MLQDAQLMQQLVHGLVVLTSTLVVRAVVHPPLIDVGVNRVFVQVRSLFLRPTAPLELLALQLLLFSLMELNDFEVAVEWQCPIFVKDSCVLAFPCLNWLCLLLHLNLSLQLLPV